MADMCDVFKIRVLLSSSECYPIVFEIASNVWWFFDILQANHTKLHKPFQVLVFLFASMWV